MLRAVIEDARLINDMREIFGMARREAVVSALLNVQQFIERVAVGQPGGAFLVGGKEVAVVVEGKPNGEANARGDDFSLGKVGRDLQDRAALALHIVMSATVLIDKIGVGIVGRSKAEVEVAVLVERDAYGVHALRNLLPAGGHDDFLVGLVIAVCIDDQ